MTSQAKTPEEYLSQLPEGRKEAITKLRQLLLENMPTGFEEVISYGMLAYVVPFSTYPSGYHCNPKQPLPFLSLANQKNHIALYHMGLYANPELLSWFTAEYTKHSTQKLDMGKSCIRFKKPEHIPYTLLKELVQQVTPQQWVNQYEVTLQR